MKCKNYHQPVETFMVCVLRYWNWCGAYPIQVQVAMTEHFKMAKEYLLHLFFTPETLKVMSSKFLAPCNATLSSSGENSIMREQFTPIYLSAELLPDLITRIQNTAFCQNRIQF